MPGDGGRLRPTRRALLASALACALPAQKPEVSSFDLSLLDDRVTPNELFFVREHFAAPAVSTAGWNLVISGAVAAPLEIPFDDLAALPRAGLAATLECAENPVGGGLVSHGEWRGASLAALLAKARPNPGAAFVRLAGADGFSRCVPLAKALHPDTLVALQMNGEKLPVNHGFPVRAVVPGWYGMDSVKWLRAVTLLEAPDPAREYQRQVRSLLAGARPVGPVSVGNVKSVFARPSEGAILVGRRFVLRGAAWAGENRVRQVEVSTDARKSWHPARLDADPRPYCWVHWSHEWTIPGPGAYELSVRAADDRGRAQPAERAPERADDYEWNGWQTVRVTVT